MTTAAPSRCDVPADAAQHHCDGKGYTCREPARLRFYGASQASLVGMQMKVVALATWACDACWAEYTRST